MDAGSGGDSLAADDVSSVKYQRVKIVVGVDGTATGDCNPTIPLPVRWPPLEIAKDNPTYVGSTILFSGRNPDVDVAAVEDVWTQGGSWAAPTTARTHDLASTSANDTNTAGTHARKVTVFGLDASDNAQSEIVNLNGTSNVATANTYNMIFELRVTDAGASETNDGDITATAQTDSTVTCAIAAGDARSRQAIYKNDAADTTYITSLFAWNNNTANNAASCLLIMAIDDDDDVVKNRQEWTASFTLDSPLNYTFPIPFQLTSDQTVKLRIQATSNNQDITAGFQIITVPN